MGRSSTVSKPGRPSHLQHDQRKSWGMIPWQNPVKIPAQDRWWTAAAAGSIGQSRLFQTTNQVSIIWLKWTVWHPSQINRIAHRFHAGWSDDLAVSGKFDQGNSNQTEGPRHRPRVSLVLFVGLVFLTFLLHVCWITDFSVLWKFHKCVKPC